MIRTQPASASKIRRREPSQVNGDSLRCLPQVGQRRRARTSSLFRGASVLCPCAQSCGHPAQIIRSTEICSRRCTRRRICKKEMDGSSETLILMFRRRDEGWMIRRVREGGRQSVAPRVSAGTSRNYLISPRERATAAGAVRSAARFTGWHGRWGGARPRAHARGYILPPADAGSERRFLKFVVA